MQKTHKLIGSAGEEAAANWLCEHGYTIITQNWRAETGEIDIIAEKEDMLAFVEVKTLPHTATEDLDIIISAKKRERISKTAKHFLQNNRQYKQMFARFDVIVIQSNPLKEETLKVLHLKNAFEDYV
ncbi:YraN family protein [Treponema phagedenis]|uniref:UPF0102 protein FUT82_11620 n=1 Tax=Treponema phagedenis TaxID=162 RepID=A0A0B7H0I6_TREPH|nr:YraN family protein [Treponema phagedenis]EFW38113.1 TIGR00252 family protein [Treponema phagedenis F0421]NVP23438.1 YraN family protein [Treponema phagedenis]QEJ95654.1 YraN family protein [Treponema phagedenis]QEJ98579.1 YraN family protein [Treponema phagedenis]QEK01512.1 YraN family protein [Treponema phagedenis]